MGLAGSISVNREDIVKIERISSKALSGSLRSIAKIKNTLHLS